MSIGVRPFLGRKLDKFADDIAVWSKTLFLKRIDKGSFARQAQRNISDTVRSLINTA